MRRKLTWALVLCLAVAVAAALASVAMAQVPKAFEVHRGTLNGVFFKGWTAGDTLVLTIDDLATTPSPDYATSVLAEEPQEGLDGFGIGIDYDVRPGDVVTVTDGATTKSHTVTDVAVTAVDTVADVAYGTALPGTDLTVYVPTMDLWTSAADDGTWMVDFSGFYDIVPGSSVSAEQYDFDGDSTVYDFEAPMTLDDLLAGMVADGRLPSAGLANGIATQAQKAPLKALTNHLTSLVAHAVITQQTMDDILAMVAG